MERSERKALYSILRDSDQCRICRDPKMETLGEQRTVSFTSIGGLGDKLCGMSAARLFARNHPHLKVKCDVPISGWFRDGLVGYARNCKHELWGSSMHSKYLYDGNSGKFKNYYGFFLDYLGFECDGRAIEMPVLDPQPGCPKEYVVFHPCAAWATSPPRELIEESLGILRRVGIPIVSVGRFGYRWEGVDHRFNGESAVRLCRIIANAKAVVTARSGPAHIAPAYSVPAFCWNPDDKMEWHVNYPGVQRFLYTDPDLMSHLSAFLEGLGLFVK